MNKHPYRKIRKINFNYLLASLVVLIIVIPVLDAYTPWEHAELLEFVFAATLILVVASLAGNAREFLAGLVVALSALLFSLASIFWDAVLFRHLMMGAALVFFVQTMVYSGQQVFSAGRVTLNKLIGAVCIYLLLGLCWAILYQFLELLAPGSFNGIASNPGQTEFPMFVYFSLVTLTTLGYGDITPASPIAGVLAALEAATGVFYIAILVAALVSDFLATRKPRD